MEGEKKDVRIREWWDVMNEKGERVCDGRMRKVRWMKKGRGRDQREERRGDAKVARFSHSHRHSNRDKDSHSHSHSNRDKDSHCHRHSHGDKGLHLWEAESAVEKSGVGLGRVG